jgi:hypothetical protein
MDRQAATKLMRETAIGLAQEGFSVFPLEVGTSPTPKAPAVDGWKEVATADPKRVATLWKTHPFNVGIATGRPFGGKELLVLDVDVKDGKPGAASLRMLEDLGLPKSWRVRTPSGGIHVYLLAEPGTVGSSLGKFTIGKTVIGGIDVKGPNGYVVAPGSVAGGREYEWIAGDDEMQPVPEWLAPALSKAKHKLDIDREAFASIGLDQEADIERAWDWLRTQCEMVGEGSRDDAGFAVACRLKDFGLSQPMVSELLAEWNERYCHPPVSDDRVAKLARNAFAYGANPPGVQSVQVAQIEFGDLVTLGQMTAEALAKCLEKPPHLVDTPEMSDPTPRGQWQALTAGQVMAGGLSRRRPLVKGLLDRGAYSILFAKPNAGKTFVALDIARHIATGTPWGNRQVARGGVLYVAGEGAGGLGARFAALRERQGLPEDAPLFVLPHAVNLFRGGEDLDRLIELANGCAEQAGIEMALIVLDTLARCTVGADENSSTDMGRFNGNVSTLIRKTGAHVMAVHHEGKDAGRGMRGSTSLDGAIDTALAVVAESTTGTRSRRLEVRKQRDMDYAPAREFTLERVTLGVDEDGDVIQSAVVEWRDGRARAPLTDTEQLIFDALVRAVQAKHPDADELDIDQDRSVSTSEWEIEIDQISCWGGEPNMKRINRTTVVTYRTSLQKKGWVMLGSPAKGKSKEKQWCVRG